MQKIQMIKPIIKEYGIRWAVNRSVYSLKLKSMSIAPFTERWYEKKTTYPSRLEVFQIDAKSLQSFLKNALNNEEKKKLIETADNACKGVITGFSSVQLDYGSPIDWQFSPLTGKRCDEKKKWYRIPDFDKERGDIKVIWEASRFSHFVTLSRAYLLTRNEKYYRAFSLQLKDWLEKNPYGYGANFKCSQECALRMINTLMAFTIFQNCGVSTDSDVSNVKDLVDRCYRKILSNFFYAYRCIKNNHTVSELTGMIIGAWCTNDHRQLEKGYNLLNEVIDEQFSKDGGYKQFSFNYQRLALQDLEVVLSISKITGRELSADSKEKIENAAWLMFQCQDETGDVPNYGSNDGALAFPVTACDYRDFRSVINTTYALVTSKQLYRDGKHQEELIWFSRGKRIDDYKTEDKYRVSSQFSDAGLFTLRGLNSWAMVVANDYHSRPAHMDQLHLDLWADGVNVLCDAGTFSYASREGWLLVKNGSHNTVEVDGTDQMNLREPFIIYDWTKRMLGECDGTCFMGKMISANGYTHTRIVKQKGVSYEISDNADEDFKVYFHTPCDILLANGEAVLSNNNKVLCRIRSSGNMELKKTERSLYYLKKEDTNCLFVKAKGNETINTIIEIVEGEKKHG